MVGPGMTVVDGGCGHEAPTLNLLRGRGARLVGVDLVPLFPQDGLELVVGDLAAVPLPESSVDLLYSRSVMEHVTDPASVYREANRLLKPCGRWIFLTANRWDYVSLVARIVPNRFHAAIVKRMEGRAEIDTFPTAYLSNDRGQIERLAAQAGFRIDRFQRLSQYPSMFHKVPSLFLLASIYERIVMRFSVLAPLRGWLLVELVRNDR
jgi:SAM-dependent methyltransferase